MKAQTLLTWKLFVAWVDGNIPWSWNNCITNCLRCSRIFRCPFSLPSLTAVLCDGVLGVRGERSELSSAASTAFTQSKKCQVSMWFHNMTKVGTHISADRCWSLARKSGFPSRRKRLTVLQMTSHFQDLTARRLLDLGKRRSLKKLCKYCTIINTHLVWATVEASYDNFVWRLGAMMALILRLETDSLAAWTVAESWTCSRSRLASKHYEKNNFQILKPMQSQWKVWLTCPCRLFWIFCTFSTWPVATFDFENHRSLQKSALAVLMEPDWW